MIFVALGPIKRTEFAVNVANVRVIDVAVGDVSHDLASASAVPFFFGQISPRVCQRAQFFQWQAIKLERFVGRNALALEHFVCETVAIEGNHQRWKLSPAAPYFRGNRLWRSPVKIEMR